MVMTRTEAITSRHTPTDLTGPELTLSAGATDFILQNHTLEQLSRDSFVENKLVTAGVPTFDLPVCGRPLSRQVNQVSQYLC